MALPWETLDSVDTVEGPLVLKRRGDHEYLITVSGRNLMSSRSTRSEEGLATLGCEALATHKKPKVLIGGLGLGFTLRAALAVLPPKARLLVAELEPAVVKWCRGPVASLSGEALADPRVEVEVADVAKVIGRDQGRWDAILIDLFEGPHEAFNAPNDPFYGAAALRRTRDALRPGGTFAVWSEQRDKAFENRLDKAGFRTVKRQHPGRGARQHVVYLASV